MDILPPKSYSEASQKIVKFLQSENSSANQSIILDPQERAITLKTQCLTGDAKKAVLAEDDEEKMLEELRVRWGKADDLVEELLRDLDSLPKAKQYDVNFIKFIDQLRTLCHNLDAIGEKGQLSNVPTLKKIIGKINLQINLIGNRMYITLSKQKLMNRQI